MPRPISVAIVSGFLFFATAIAAVVGVSLLFPNPLLDRLWELNPEGAALFHSIGRISGLFLLALGGGTLAAGFGLLRRRRWAWWFAAALFAINAAGDVVSYFMVHDALRTAAGVIVSSLFLVVLLRRNARHYFFCQALTPNHNP
jgi:hypothetical protein